MAWKISDVDHGVLVAMPASEPRMERVSGALPFAARAALEEAGLVVLPGPFSVEQLDMVADVYDAEVHAAVGDDIRVGSTSTRVVGFVNRGPLLDPLYVYPPLLDAAAQVVGPMFKLSDFGHRRCVTDEVSRTIIDLPG